MKYDDPLRKGKGILIIILGILLMLYPLFTDLYSNTLQANRWTDYRKGELGLKDGEETPVILKGRNDGGWEVSDRTNKATTFTEGLLRIPAIELSALVLCGTSQEILKQGLGWYENSALPGEGNTAIAGHRTMHAGLFRNLNKLKAGDLIYLEFAGYVYRYRVANLYQVEYTDWSVIEPCDYIALTLTTCVKGDAEHRQVVRAVFCDKEVKGK